MCARPAVLPYHSIFLAAAHLPFPLPPLPSPLPPRPTTPTAPPRPAMSTCADLMNQLEAVSRLLAAMRGTPDAFHKAASAQATLLHSQLRRTSFSVEEAAAMAQAIKSVSWPEAELAALLTAMAEAPQKAAGHAVVMRHQLQDPYLHGRRRARRGLRYLRC